MRLPAWQDAVIDVGKLRDYLLSESHIRGRFKAIFFTSLGYRASNWRQLEVDIRSLIDDAHCLIGPATAYGQKYLVSGTLTGPSSRSERVVTVWIVLKGEAAPRFLTAYPEAR